jgi:hypothetical protein
MKYTALLAALGALGLAAPSFAQEPPPPPPSPEVAPVPPAQPPPPPPAPPPPAVPAPEALAGFSDGTAFLRSADGEFVLLPNGRLQVDGYFFKSDNPTPNNGFLLRRARAELAGWVGPWFFFSIAGDFAAGSPAGANPVGQANLNATDDYVAVAPWGDLAILQFGQFDAPFTLENRTSDKYFDFMERSITVRAFGAPTNKELGFMLHGLHPDKLFYYSAGVFNGDGQNFRNADTAFDFIGRAWVAPLALTKLDALKSITLGGSLWLGKKNNALPLPAQTTQAGFAFFKPSWSTTNAMGTAVPFELHQSGNLTAWAVEVDAPFAHKAGLRWEYVGKRQKLATNDVTKPDKQTAGGAATLKGYSTYGEAWFWVLGDDRIIGAPGLQLPPRLKKFGTTAPRSGLMLAARVEYLNETVTEAADTAALMLGDKVAGRTKVTSFELGANYWYSKRYRTTFNYVLNHFGGDAPFVQALKSKQEHELLFRLAIAL